MKSVLSKAPPAAQGIVSIRTSVPVPLANGHRPHFTSFHNLCDGREHIALLFDGWKDSDTPLVRLHSECLTGEVFGSQRCECGNQLAEAMARCAEQGGIVLYLRQEGRDIGLYNKLDAYKLQIEDGLDTFEANTALGHPVDGRNYKAAAEMLEALGVRHLRLLSNNPDKAAQLERYGLHVAQTVPTGVHLCAENRPYLAAKRDLGGHTICLDAFIG